MVLVPGKDTLSSGTGAWTIGVPPNSTIAIDDPGVEGQFPTVELATTLQSAAPASFAFIGDITTIAPNPPDAIGFTAEVAMTFTNDTGAALPGLLLTLANDDPKLPLSLVPGVVEFGNTVNANYAYFAAEAPVPGETTTLFSPDGKVTTPTGAAASTIALTGTIPVGGSVSIATVIHNTELSMGSNNFHLFVSPA
jgi:hypothetical protein